MNQRIKELAEQNGFIHNWQPPGEQNDRLKTLEKFAELIVRECAGITDDNLIPDHPITGAVYDGIQSKKILEHFGVKE